MSQFHSLPPFQRDHAGMTGEQYIQGVHGVESVSGSPFPAMPTSGVFTTGQQSVNNTDQFAPVTQMQPVMTTQPITTQQYTPLPGVLHDVATTQSLISALQSTMLPTKQAARKPVVIPGKRRRTGAAQKVAGPDQRMHPHLRFGIIGSVTLFVLLLTLLSLAPLGSGQSKYTLLGNAVALVQAHQESWNIVAHLTNSDTQPQAAQQNTDSAPAVGLPPNLPMSAYVKMAQDDAVAEGISPNYFVRQIYQESGFNPRATSPAGAVGIAQFLPSTARGLGFDPFDPVAALKAAAHLMATTARQYGGDYAKALAAYNAGGGAVDAAVSRCGGAWLSCMPSETQNYIRIIMG